MSYLQEVKEIAYKLDPEAWKSYAGKKRDHKQMMERRRVASLALAVKQFDEVSNHDTEDHE